MDIEVHDHRVLSRYEARVGTELAGIAAYERDDTRITFTHTAVEDAFEGQGVGGALARHALDEARSAGLKVRPWCPFFRGWIERHPDYADLVTR